MFGHGQRGSFVVALHVDKDMDGRLNDEIIVENLRGQMPRRNMPMQVTETCPAHTRSVHFVVPKH